MTGCGTVTGDPLAGGIGIDFAILTSGNPQNFVARIAFFNNGMTAAPIEPATFLCHKSAFRADFDALTDHLYLIPFSHFL